MRPLLALFVAGALAVFAGGCGDDDEGGSDSTDQGSSTAGDEEVDVSGDAQPYVDAMIESFDESDPDQLQIDREQAECLAPRWVEIMGPERLAAAGIEPDDFSGDGDVDLSSVGLSEDDGNAMYDAFGECDIDFRELMVESLAAGEDLSEEALDCVRNAFDDDLVRRAAITALVEGEEALNEDEELSGDLIAALSECPEVLTTD